MQGVGGSQKPENILVLAKIHTCHSLETCPLPLGGTMSFFLSQKEVSIGGQGTKRKHIFFMVFGPIHPISPRSVV